MAREFKSTDERRANEAASRLKRNGETSVIRPGAEHSQPATTMTARVQRVRVVGRGRVALVREPWTN